MRYDHGSEPYREKRLQMAAMSWARAHLSYRPIADDVEATGDRMDAVGMLGDELVLIETKPDVGESIVRFNPGMDSTIEPKIAATLAELYQGGSNGQVGVIADHWNRRKPLTIVILAGNYTHLGRKVLAEMLLERSKEWHFHYRIWRWTGEQIDELDHVAASDIPKDRDWASIRIPEMIARPERRMAATVEELRAIASRSGMLEILDAILARSHDLKMSRKRRVAGINLHLRNNGKPLWCSIFVTEEDLHNGLNCGIDADIFDRSGLPLPGSEAPRKGFLNTNRFIRSHSDVAELFAPFYAEV